MLIVNVDTERYTRLLEIHNLEFLTFDPFKEPIKQIVYLQALQPSKLKIRVFLLLLIAADDRYKKLINNIIRQIHSIIESKIFFDSHERLNS